ncbi:carbohydrate-binding domain-containing protein [Jiulongibacter sediminis]|uniref:Dockerin type 1 n=1 Tax=Jiulongibacter sediminis TaxID=1605367 RepID=A0A0N8H9Q1_9BACT|nr:carbohydrate-binding domain-containing protein [Jiulongibacter sediminis]KPM47996.1 hypothetical protein AFM12_12355 [Jiulongibacter sediminis]
MNRLRIKALMLTGLLTLLMACNDLNEVTPDTETGVEIPDVETELENPNETEADYNWDDTGATNIILKNSIVEISGEGASSSGSEITISKAGTYNISGSLTDGQLVIDSDDSENVNIILNAASITSKTSSAISIISAEKVVFQLKEGTENTITDAGTYDANDEKNGALYSKADLSFFGQGSLTVNANFEDGIVSKDGLIIESGSFIVNAADDAIRGKDYVLIHNGNFDLSAGGDGITSTNDEDESLGFVDLKNGNYTIASGADAIQAVTVLTLENGTYDLTTGGGSSKSTTNTAKALKAGVKLLVSGGTYDINSADDALHSNQYITIKDGSFEIVTADDGVHADEALLIDGGSITVSKSYEGLESASITVNDGNIWITSSDDGINAADGSSSGFGGPGGFSNSGATSVFLYINGGYLVVNASGDGLDANGSIVMTGGTVLVHGPTESMNGSLDYDRSFQISGGTLVAVGSSRMAQKPDNSSTQPSILANLSQTQSAGVVFDITDSKGEEIICFQPMKKYQSIVYSGSNLKSGNSYNLSIGGTSTGANSDGLIAGGNYSGGTSFGTITL